MKKNILMAIFAIALFASCQKDESMSEGLSNTTIASEISEALEVELCKDENGESVLSFKTESDMMNQLDKFQSMSEVEKKQWYTQFDGFVSQNQFMWSVVDELDNAKSMEEVKSIHKKYANLLVFNENEADRDIAPYIPSTFIGNDKICNKYGNVMIGGEICNFNNVSSYYQLTNPLVKNSGYSLINGIGVTEGDRRLWVETYRQDYTGYIYLKLAAHRDTWFGWNKYKTIYYLRLNSNSGPMTNFIVMQNMKKAQPGFFSTGEIDSGDFHKMLARHGDVRVNITAYSRGVSKQSTFDTYLNF